MDYIMGHFKMDNLVAKAHLSGMIKKYMKDSLNLEI
jgi:hypothetical protein